MGETDTFEVACPSPDCDELLVVDGAAKAYASVTLDCEGCGKRFGLRFGDPYQIVRDHAEPIGCLCCGRDEAAP